MATVRINYDKDLIHQAKAGIYACTKIQLQKLLENNHNHLLNKSD